ncbi:MAG: T9SS type A sorting domain-containing protein [Bacteroidota bacterium]|nr:T9SS type A sorting domain-containing protein [Bacteroidota bacterium]
MKTILPLLLFLLSNVALHAQEIHHIATYDNTYSTSSGILGITDTAIYEYSWYSENWLAFPSNGLARDEEAPIINEIAACNNNSHNPSGIYVISDTAVHVYNYYAAYWYSLENNGLQRISGIVQLSNLNVRYDTEDDYVDVFVKSGNQVYRYNRYTQSWYSLPNTGLTKAETNTQSEFEMQIFPNPVKNNAKLELNIKKNNLKDIEIHLYNRLGKHISTTTVQHNESGTLSISLNLHDLSPGIYFYEVTGEGFSHVRQFVKID